MDMVCMSNGIAFTLGVLAFMVIAGFILVAGSKIEKAAKKGKSDE